MSSDAGSRLSPCHNLLPPAFTAGEHLHLREPFSDCSIDEKCIDDVSFPRAPEKVDELCQWLSQELENQRAAAVRAHQKLLADLRTHILKGQAPQLGGSLEGTPNPLQQGARSGGGETADAKNVAPPAQAKANSDEPEDEYHRHSRLDRHTRAKFQQHLQNVMDAINRESLKIVEKARKAYQTTTEKRGGWGESHGFQSKIRFVVEGITFQLVFAAAIILNTAVSATEHQYQGFKAGWDISYVYVEEPAEDTWPIADVFFRMSGLAFGVIFAIEVIIKLAAFGPKFFKEAWNLLDFFLVFVWAYAEFATLKVNLVFLRLLRVVKLLRLAKVFHSFRCLESLHVLIGSLKASAAVLAWSIILLFMLQMIVALACRSLLESYILDVSKPEAARHKVYEYFGTFSRSMLTTFELTLGNWVPVCRLLFNEVHEVFGLSIIVYKLTIGFAVVKVITGVFMQQTFAVAGQNQEIMLMQQERMAKSHINNMAMLFAQADTSGDGYINIDEFIELLNDRVMRAWLTSMGLDVTDIGTLFDLIDSAESSSGDGQISALELCLGVKSLKGPARALELAAVARKHERMLREILKRLPKKEDEEPLSAMSENYSERPGSWR